MELMMRRLVTEQRHALETSPEAASAMEERLRAVILAEIFLARCGFDLGGHMATHAGLCSGVVSQATGTSRSTPLARRSLPSEWICVCRLSQRVRQRALDSRIWETYGLFRRDGRRVLNRAPWGWIWLALRRLFVPEWLVSGLQALYGDSYSDVVFGGMVSDHGFLVRWGILQGCPASGDSFRSSCLGVACCLPRIGRVVDRMRGDLAAALLNVISGLGPLFEVCLLLPMATGSTYTSRRSRSSATANARALTSRGVCTVALTFPLLPSGVLLDTLGCQSNRPRPRATQTLLFRNTGIAVLLFAPHLRTCGSCGIYCLSVWLFLRQLAKPDARIARVPPHARVSRRCPCVPLQIHAALFRFSLLFVLPSRTASAAASRRWNRMTRRSWSPATMHGLAGVRSASPSRFVGTR